MCVPPAVRRRRGGGAAGAAPAAAAPAANASDADAVEGTAPKKRTLGEERFWQALKLLHSKQAAELQAGRVALQAAADLEFTHAQVLLADCLFAGSYGFAKDRQKGANLLRLAAERGNAFAEVSFGQCLLSGTGVRKDEAKATTWLVAALSANADYSRPVPPDDYVAGTASDGEASAVAGELEHDPVGEAQATAHYLLGQISAKNKKLDEAQGHFVAAAVAGPGGRDGIYPAALQAALNYAFGNGTPRNLDRANEMIAQSRKLVSRMSVSLIHNYVALKVVDEFATADLEESVSKAAEEYETGLQYKIAETFADKKSKDYNVAEAVKWYELAAESGEAWAMLSLAFIYSQGDLGHPDPARAFFWFQKAGGGDSAKHYLGAANLAICYQNGIGTPRDPAKAAALFKKYRDDDIVCYLGSIGQCPARVVTYDQVVALNQNWAREKNDAQAQYLLGFRFLNGQGVKEDIGDAVKWYKKASKANNALALFALGSLHDRRPLAVGDDTVAEGKKSAIELYRRAADLGNTGAMVNYAYMVDRGEGVTADAEKAAAIYEKCLVLDPRQKLAHNNLGAYYEEKLKDALQKPNGPDADALRKKMLHHYEESMHEEEAYAAKNLGQLYRNGELVGKDLRKAYGYFEQAAAWGYGDYVHYVLGLMHENGEGVPVTYSEAAYHYRLAALDGNLEALRRLINFYLTGQGVDQDLDRAAFWMDQLVRRGEIGVLIPLADVMVRRGQFAVAIKLLKQLSEVDQPVIAGYACERLSRYYESGLGVKADSDKARRYFDRAVEAGNGDALTRLALHQLRAKNTSAALANLEKASVTSPAANFYLGQMYFFGTNVPKDEAKAVRHVHVAAEGNFLEALYFLAALTYNQAAGAPPIDEAIRFAQQAETGGLEKARSLREKLEQRRKAANLAPEPAAPPRS